MRKSLAAIAILVLLVVATGCGPSDGGEEAAGTTPAGGSDVPVSSPTPIVLGTPTPRLAPPTPTSIPLTPTSEAQTGESQGPAVADVMVEIPAGPFIMGSDEGDPEDAPAHEVDLPAFEIDKFEITNADFATFVEEAGYVTFAEQQGYGNWRDEWGEGEDKHPVVMVT